MRHAYRALTNASPSSRDRGPTRDHLIRSLYRVRRRHQDEERHVDSYVSIRCRVRLPWITSDMTFNGHDVERGANGIPCNHADAECGNARKSR
jgi:hypothetical protein